MIAFIAVNDLMQNKIYELPAIVVLDKTMAFKCKNVVSRRHICWSTRVYVVPGTSNTQGVHRKEETKKNVQQTRLNPMEIPGRWNFTETMSQRDQLLAEVRWEDMILSFWSSEEHDAFQNGPVNWWCFTIEMATKSCQTVQCFHTVIHIKCPVLWIHKRLIPNEVLLKSR